GRELLWRPARAGKAWRGVLHADEGGGRTVAARVEPPVLMPTLRVGNAPCSWGTLEFEETKGEQIEYGRMLDELVETGYTGTELDIERGTGYSGYEPEAGRVEGRSGCRKQSCRCRAKRDRAANRFSSSLGRVRGNSRRDRAPSGTDRPEPARACVRHRPLLV